MNEWIVYALGTLALTSPSPSGHAELSTVEDARPAPVAARQALGSSSEPVLPLATDGSGDILRELGREDAARAGSTQLRPGALGIVHPESDQVEQVRGPGQSRAGTQTVFGAVNKDHAIWTEQTSTKVSESDWTMYGFDRDSGERTVLAEAKPIDDQGTMPTVPGFTVPTLDQDTVYWAQADRNPNDPRKPSVNVYAGKADGSDEPTVAVHDAIMPVATSDWLYYVPFDGSDSSSDGYTVERKSLHDGKTEVVTERSTGTITELAAEGDTVAVGRDGNAIDVFSGTERTTTVEGADQERLGQLSLANGVLGFNDNSKHTGQNYALQLDSEELFELGPAPGLARVLVTGPSDGAHTGLAWARGNQEQRWQYGQLNAERSSDGGPPGAHRD